MVEDRIQRRLAAILAADVAGYSRLMGGDEEGTFAALTAHRAELIEPCIAEHRGRVVKTTGDGLLAEFASVVDAMRCAVAFQEGMRERNSDIPEDRRIEFRIGVNLGDIIVEDDDIYGDGVNVAARLEALAEPGGICLSGDAYRQVKGKVDAAFADMGEQRVKNIAEPVHAYRVVLANAAGDDSPAAALLERPAVAVLPFTNLSGDPEQEYFSDGITEDIITALAAYRSFPVIARNSTFAYKGRSLDVRQVANELGARYVLEGSVRKGGNRVRITAQLIDAGTGHHLWAERLDWELEDIFELQDKVTQRIVATMAPELDRAEQKRSITKKPKDLDAWDSYQRGMALLSEFTKEGNARAREMFEHAIQLDPTYGQAFSGLAQSHNRDLMLEFWDSREDSAAKCLEAARRGVALDDTDSFAHLLMAIAHMWPGRMEFAIAEATRAVELNPSNAFAYGVLGTALDSVGRSEDGISALEKAFQLNPRDNQNHILINILARAHLTARRYEEAVEWARKAIHRRSDFPHGHYILAASLGHLGRRDEARAALDECERIQPGFIDKRARWEPYRNPADNQHILDGVRKA